MSFGQFIQKKEKKENQPLNAFNAVNCENADGSIPTGVGVWVQYGSQLIHCRTAQKPWNMKSWGILNYGWMEKNIFVIPSVDIPSATNWQSSGKNDNQSSAQHDINSKAFNVGRKLLLPKCGWITRNSSQFSLFYVLPCKSGRDKKYASFSFATWRKEQIPSKWWSRRAHGISVMIVCSLHHPNFPPKRTKETRASLKH